MSDQPRVITAFKISPRVYIHLFEVLLQRQDFVHRSIKILSFLQRRNYSNICTEPRSLFILKVWDYMILWRHGETTTAAVRGTFEQGTITPAVSVGCATCPHTKAATVKLKTGSKIEFD